MDFGDRPAFQTPEEFYRELWDYEEPNDSTRLAGERTVEYMRKFFDEVNRRAENNMLKTGRLEGSHFAAMVQLRKEVLREDD